MKLIDYSIKDFCNELASNSPAPGGGSTAAVEASFGAGLIAMVCELTLANKKYVDITDQVTRIRDQAVSLKEELLRKVDEDTEAFNLVSAAFAMPKETDEEKAERRNAIQNGLKECCIPPLMVMGIVDECLKLAAELINNYNTSTASDLGTGIVSLKAAAHGAYMNVLINAGSIKDEDFVSEKKQKADSLIKNIDALADELYQKVLSSL